jgi:hypothetical protein
MITKLKVIKIAHGHGIAAVEHKKQPKRALSGYQ